MNTEKARVPGRWIFVAGGLLTLLYLIVLAVYCIDRWPAIQAMPPNNVGDFLAGAFSPMAFAWLVLGFLQQGIELRHYSAALLLQAQELRSAATHAGAMVDLQILVASMFQFNWGNFTANSQMSPIPSTLPSDHDGVFSLA